MRAALRTFCLLWNENEKYVLQEWLVSGTTSLEEKIHEASAAVEEYRRLVKQAVEEVRDRLPLDWKGNVIEPKAEKVTA